MSAGPMYSDHPHTRGENLHANADLETTLGPSPHAWGKLSGGDNHVTYKRTIPTRVGKTWPALLPKASLADHPHTRGENNARLIAAAPEIRTIPTRVGKTS